MSSSIADEVVVGRSVDGADLSRIVEVFRTATFRLPLPTFLATFFILVANCPRNFSLVILNFFCSFSRPWIVRISYVLLSKHATGWTGITLFFFFFPQVTVLPLTPM
jgi:hypothetical protein